MARPEDEQRIPASDGLVARESGEWAKDKLYFVQRYQHMFATGMKHRRPHRVYLDLMAGPGLCRIRQTGEEFSGSPLLSLQETDFTRRIFVEAEPDLAEALDTRARAVGGQFDIITRDCNAPSVIQQMRDATEGDDVLGLAFVDNLGLDVPFETLARLIHGRSIDLLVVIQLQDLRRNVLNALKGGVHRKRFDAFIGDRRWTEFVSDVVPENSRSTTVAEALIQFYLERFAVFGHSHVRQGNYAMRNSNNATLYRLAIIAGHQRGVDFFREAGAIEPGGQRQLFPDE